MSERRPTVALARGRDGGHGDHPAWTPDAQLAALDRIERIENALAKIFGEAHVTRIDWHPAPWVATPIRHEDLDPEP